MKTVSTARSHQLKGDDLADLHRQAAQQGKTAKYVVHFTAHGITAEITLHKENLETWE